MNKRIILGLGMIVFVAAVVAGGTGAFFSDSETSSGNTFTAGAIDLGIDNESYYNGVANAETSWQLAYDLDDGQGPSTGGAYLFFDFDDLKPGDWGEDTISVHVDNNDAWACAYVTLTEDEENTINEPEEDLNDTNAEGELDDELHFVWWADDGDNVLEDDETVINEGILGDAPVGFKHTVTLADSTQNIWDGSGPLPGADTHYIGKAWCFGDLEKTPVAAGQGVDPTVDPGITCDGSTVTNLSQTDSAKLDVEFFAVQSRNNADFVCADPVNPGGPTVTEGSGWSPNAGSQEWFAKAKVQEPNPASDFEVQVGVGDSNPADFDSADTEYPNGSSTLFTLEYDGAGTATFTANGASTTYAVGSSSVSNLGLTVRAPSDATTTVEFLALSTGSLSDTDVSVSDGTAYLLISGATLDAGFTLTGSITFDWVTLTSNGENQKLQISVD